MKNKKVSVRFEIDKKWSENPRKTTGFDDMDKPGGSIKPANGSKQNKTKLSSPLKMLIFTLAILLVLFTGLALFGQSFERLVEEIIALFSS